MGNHKVWLTQWQYHLRCTWWRLKLDRRLREENNWVCQMKNLEPGSDSNFLKKFIQAGALNVVLRQNLGLRGRTMSKRARENQKQGFTKPYSDALRRSGDQLARYLRSWLKLTCGRNWEFFLKWVLGLKKNRQSPSLPTTRILLQWFN